MPPAAAAGDWPDDVPEILIVLSSSAGPYEEAQAALEALGLGRRPGQLHFRATLVMPFPIQRCNACAVGDTAVWEFQGAELYGRGFEMMALSSAP